MPISSQQWRVKTGMMNFSKGFKPTVMIKPYSRWNDDRFRFPPSITPPSDWKGYTAARSMLCLPLFYKVYITVSSTLYLFKEKSQAIDGGSKLNRFGLLPQIQPTQAEFRLMLLLFALIVYVTTSIVLLVLGNGHRTRQKECRWTLMEPLQSMNLMWLDKPSGSRGARFSPAIIKGRIYAIFEMEPECTLQCVHELSWLPKGKARRVVMDSGAQCHVTVSFILQLSTIVVAMLLLLAGDVERNPGPPPDIKTLINELKTVIDKYSEIGIQLGLKLEKIQEIEYKYPGNTERRFTEVLNFWLGGNTTVLVRWESIVDVLNNVEKKVLAKQIHTTYCVASKDEADSKLVAQAASLHSDKIDEAKWQMRLSADMDRMREKFQELLVGITCSLEKRNVPISRIVTRIRGFSAFEPVYSRDDQRPILEHRIMDLNKAKSIDEAMNIIGHYCSFFNYHLIEQIIKYLGTKKDKRCLEDYKQEYKTFAENMICNCPLNFKGPADEHQRVFCVKLNETFNSCTESHLIRFLNKLSEVLHLSTGTLLLESIRWGCLELKFQVPLFVFQKIFPLSSHQESALAALGVIKISAGDYQYPPPDDDDGDGGDDKDDKPDDGPDSDRPSDSGIDTLSTILSEISEMSKDVVIDFTNPYKSTTEDSDSGHKLKRPVKEEKIVPQPLHIASFTGNLKQVHILVDSKKFNPLDTDEGENTALHYAAYGSQLEVLKYFIECHECNPTQLFGEHGETPLHIACRKGDFKMVSYLIIDQQVDPMCEDKCHRVTPLHAACVGGNIKIVRLLVKELRNYTPIGEFVNDRTTDNDSPLHLAAFNGNLDVVKYFLSELSYYCDPNIKGQRGETPLHKAAHGGHVETVKYLIITKNCNPFQLDDSKRIPLILAARSKSLETVKYLIKIGCDRMYRDSHGDTPLHYAAHIGSVETVVYFISDLNLDPNTLGAEDSVPLHAAAQGNSVEVMEYLIDVKHCNPSAVDKHNKTPLHYAATFGRLDAVKYLTIIKHCDPVCKDSDGNTPLYFAAVWGHISTTKFFISEMKCSPNLPGMHGSTPLHVAAERGHLEILQYLIEVHNCNPSVKNSLGASPLHYAAVTGQLAVVQYLTRNKMCDPCCRNFRLETPLHWAVFQQRNEVVRFFVTELNCDPSIQGGSYFSPLFFGVGEGHLETVKALLSNKEKLPTNLNTELLMHVAASKGHVGILDFFISELNCNPNIANQNGITPLQAAAKAGHKHVVKYLIEAIKGGKNQVQEDVHNSSQESTGYNVEDTSQRERLGTQLNDGEKTLLSKSKHGDLLNCEYYTPTFKDLPLEKDLNQYYIKRDGVNWLFMAEITTTNVLSQIYGQMYQNQTLVCDRNGKDDIPILFCNSEVVFDFAALKKGHTIFIMQASKYCFQDGTTGIRIKDFSTVFVIPCNMRNMLKLSTLFYSDRKDASCWSCGKKASSQQSNKLRKCTACRVASYCGKECQTKDWKGTHQKLCKVIPHFMKLQVNMFSEHTLQRKSDKEDAIQLNEKHLDSSDVELTGVDEPLSNALYFPAFNDLPNDSETDVEKFCNKRGSIDWIFMAEIMSESSAMIQFPYSNSLLVRDRIGKNNIPIYSKDPLSSTEDLDVKVGHTVFVIQATKHQFTDGTIGLCLQDLSNLFTVPCGMSDLLEISSLYYKRKDTKCWSCGKSVKLKWCGKCKIAHYCSRDCQAKDWKEHHKKLCTALPHFHKKLVKQQ